MWISNTATTAMMIPIVEAIAQVSVEGHPDEEEDPQNAPLASQDPSNAGNNFVRIQNLSELKALSIIEEHARSDFTNPHI